MELFANKIKFDSDGKVVEVGGESPRANFDDFIHAFTSIFIIIIGEVRTFLVKVV